MPSSVLTGAFVWEIGACDIDEMSTGVGFRVGKLVGCMSSSVLTGAFVRSPEGRDVGVISTRASMVGIEVGCPSLISATAFNLFSLKDVQGENLSESPI